jgi:putative membrane protein
VDPRVRQMDAAAARLLFDEQAARAAAARRIAGPERWLEPRPGGDAGMHDNGGQNGGQNDEQLEQDHGRG